MILHDPSDIFLEAAKIAQYVGHESLATASFAMLVVSWFILRLLVFPFWLISSAMYLHLPYPLFQATHTLILHLHTLILHLHVANFGKMQP